MSLYFENDPSTSIEEKERVVRIAAHHNWIRIIPFSLGSFQQYSWYSNLLLVYKSFSLLKKVSLWALTPENTCISIRQRREIRLCLRITLSGDVSNKNYQDIFDWRYLFHKRLDLVLEIFETENWYNYCNVEERFKKMTQFFYWNTSSRLAKEKKINHLLPNIIRKAGLPPKHLLPNIIVIKNHNGSTEFFYFFFIRSQAKKQSFLDIEGKISS